MVAGAFIRIMAGTTSNVLRCACLNAVLRSHMAPLRTKVRECVCVQGAWESGIHAASFTALPTALLSADSYPSLQLPPPLPVAAQQRRVLPASRGLGA
jgi:hypothetical protein